MKQISLLGMFRSGTNFTKIVLESNYEVVIDTDAFGWKHGFLPILSKHAGIAYPGLDYVYVTKNPFSSIWSLYNYFSSNKRNIRAAENWKKFLRSRFVILDGWTPGSPQFRFSTPVDYWNSMNWNLASGEAGGTACVHVRYESFLEQTQHEAERVAGALGIERRSEHSQFVVPEERVRNLGSRQRVLKAQTTHDEKFDRESQTAHVYMDSFDTEDTEYVLASVDRELVKRLGYADLLKDIGARVRK